MTDLVAKYFEALEPLNAHHDAGNWRFYLSQICPDIDWAGKRVLDIGGGRGLLTAYAAAAGAELAILMEPELDGSSSGMQDTFLRLVEHLGLEDKARLEKATLQGFEWEDEGFDIILLHNSINHLDEPATQELHRQASARSVFDGLFSKLASLSRPGAKMMIADCDRYNVWRFIPGLSSPVAAGIEWHKHQPPERWAASASTAGFRKSSVRWTTFNRLRRPGRLLLGNRAASYMLNSHFVMWLERPG